MFWLCSSLKSAPKLPATTLAPGCYNSMFWGCTALTAAPTLPATTLAKECYKAMFYGCTTLTTAPDLLAPTLVTDCYMLMFKGCTNLSYVKCLATSGINMDNNTYSWLENVAATGTLAADNDATWPANSKDGIPSGSDAGDFEFADNVLTTYKDAEHSVMIKYDYVDGQLTNNGHFLKKR